MNLRIRKALMAAAAFTAALSATAVAGPDKIAFPKEFEKWERYAVVDRYDNKQYRELYAKPDDRWEANDVAKLLPEVVAELAAQLAECEQQSAVG